jgi:S-DNA-T family DNA segregation ATPase FtsK/SpoIIIE
MGERPRWTHQAHGLALLFAAVFLALSLGGYHPADPPGGLVWRARPEPPRNPCGPVGAALAYGLFQAIGWAGWGVLWALLVVVGHVLRRRTMPEPAQRLAGLTLTLVMLAGLIQTFAPKLRPTPPVGPGGYAGAILATVLGAQFGPVGRALILLALFGTGLALCYDTYLGGPARELGRLLAPLGGPLRRRRPTIQEAAPASSPGPFVYETHTPLAPLHPITIHDGATLPPPPTRAALPRAAVPVGPAVPSLMPAVRRHETPASFPIPADGSYVPPPPELLDPPAPFAIQEHEARIQERALLLEKTLREHGCTVRVVQIDTGPVITQFEVELEAGLRVSKVAGLSNDLAIALAVPSVRIVAPIPGKTTVGIEVPNDRRAMVRLGEVIAGVAPQLAQGKMRIPLFLGKDVKGTPLAYDLADMPHLLIAGRTGTGKSVCLNAMILSILMTRRPDEVKLILIDPKMVELSQFKRIPHLMHPPVTDMKKAESILGWACEKMDERYAILGQTGVRNVQAYNALSPEEIYERLRPESDEEMKRIPTRMPYIVIVADEMADLMMVAAKEVETHIVRLAQKARAAGIHLILATQRPTVDVITGLIKGNMPARIGFQVTSRNDSRVVMDEMGAEKLLGNGDLLFLIPGTSHIIRAQGTYVSDAEVNRICGYLEQYPVEFSKELVQLQMGGALAGKDGAQAMKDRDEMYEAAIEIVIREQRGSTSLLQRALGIGYGRAARLIDYMAEDGIVGEYKSGSAREVLYSWEEWESLKRGAGGGEDSEAA